MAEEERRRWGRRGKPWEESKKMVAMQRQERSVEVEEQAEKRDGGL